LVAAGDFQEAIYYEQKGVDVKLAIDMIAQIDTYDVAILLAGDADFVGLAKLVRQYNRHIINAHFPPNRDYGYYFSFPLEQTCDRPPIVLDQDYLADCTVGDKAARKEFFTQEDTV